MVATDELGLSLSLSPSESRFQFQLQLALMPSSSPVPFYMQNPNNGTTQWSNLLSHSGVGLRGIDVNRLPERERENDEEDEEEEGGVSSPNSTVSSVSGRKREAPLSSTIHASAGDDNDAERACSRSTASDEEDGDGSRKKLRLSKDQSAVLEESFKEHNTLNPKQKLALAKQLNLRPRQVEVWFQNRRARTKLKQTELDCEFLKRCCENLTEENRQLQKEVAELRSLKLSPQFYMHMTPPTTLTMCPSCERVAVSTTGAGGGSKQWPATGHRQQQKQQQHRVGIAAPRPFPNATIPLNAAFVDSSFQRS